MNNWVETSEGMRLSISIEELAELLYKRMKDSKALAYELKQFVSASHRTPHEGDHTHDFLITSMENFVSDHREPTSATNQSCELLSEPSSALQPYRHQEGREVFTKSQTL